MPEEQIRIIVSNTVAVLTQMPEKRDALDRSLQQAQTSSPDGQLEIEFYTTVLALLDGEAAMSLPADHPYAVALAQILSGLQNGGDQRHSLITAIQAYLDAPDWITSQRVVEQKQFFLFQTEIDTIFEATIAQMRLSGNQYMFNLLTENLILLRACKASGITTASAGFLPLSEPSPDSSDPALTEDSTARCVHGLESKPPEKVAFFTYLGQLSPSTESITSLITVIQQALFAPDPAAVDPRALNGVYAAAWSSILSELKGQSS